MRYVGDVHGDMAAYAEAIRGCDASVQVGDFGVGFMSPSMMAMVDQFHHANPTHRFIRGNHDDPDACKQRPGYIPDGHFDDETDTLFIGGAWSIDFYKRTPGVNWWIDEELSIRAFVDLVHLFQHLKPSRVVTHDCPGDVARELFFRPPFDTRNQFRTRTSTALDAMLDAHKPKEWLFGHWHEDHDVELWGTRFICLGINSYVDL